MLARRDFLKTAALAPLTLNAASAPNIVYILADDLGWGDLECYNPESRIPTPSIAKLARQGMRFTDMHSPSAVCTPTRYGIMTGRYCWRTSLKNGVLWGYSPNLIEGGRMTVASLLKSRGYHTACFGKWHLGLGDLEKADYSKPLHPCPNDHGFDYFFGIPASLDMEPYLYIENDRAVEQPTAHTPGQDSPRGVFWRPGPIAPGLKIDQVLPDLTTRAAKYIQDRAKQPDKPFFLYLPLTGPHTPWVPLQKFRGKSKAGDYGDFVTQVDDSVGQVLRALKDANLETNTLVIFTSDNGAHWTPEDKEKFPHRANAHWRGQKSDIHEAGHRVPFIVRWPGSVKPGSSSSQLGCLTDLMATVADIAGVTLPRGAGEDSFSLLPALKGSKGSREAIVHHSANGTFAIRKGEWKLILGRGSGGFTAPVKIEPKPGEPAGELYRLTRDPLEQDNQYLRHTQTVAELTALLERYKSSGHSRSLE